MFLGWNGERQPLARAQLLKPAVHCHSNLPAVCRETCKLGTHSMNTPPSQEPDMLLSWTEAKGREIAEREEKNPAPLVNWLIKEGTVTGK